MDKLERIGELFAGLHFDREIIPRYVRWQAEPGDLVEMIAKCGLSLVHTTTHTVGAALYTGV